MKCCTIGGERRTLPSFDEESIMMMRRTGNWESKTNLTSCSILSYCVRIDVLTGPYYPCSLNKSITMFILWPQNHKLIVSVVSYLYALNSYNPTEIKGTTHPCLHTRKKHLRSFFLCPSSFPVSIETTAFQVEAIPLSLAFPFRATLKLRNSLKGVQNSLTIPYIVQGRECNRSLRKIFFTWILCLSKPCS